MNTRNRLSTKLLLLLVAAGVFLALPCRASDVETKMKQVVIPSLEAADVTVAQLFDLIVSLARDSDPEPDARRKGVNIVLDLTQADREKRISWRGNRKSIIAILENVCLMADLVCTVRGEMVWVSSSSKAKQWLHSRVFDVDASLTAALKADGVRPYMEKRGVTFPAGAVCSFDPGTGRMFAQNTLANLALIETTLYVDAHTTVAARRDRKPRLKGGAFANEDISHLHGGRMDKQSMVANPVGSLTPSLLTDMENYEDAVRLRVASIEQARLADRLDRVVIPELELKAVTLIDALLLLEDLAFDYSKTSAEGQEDFQTVLKVSDKEKAKTVTIHAKGITVAQAIRAILGSTGLHYEYRGSSLLVTSPAVEQGKESTKSR
jgi:hypothetical protein